MNTYTSEERVIITSIANLSMQLSLWHSKFYTTKEFRDILVEHRAGVNGKAIFSTIQDVGFFNEGSLPSLLYTLLVYPKEAIKKLNCEPYNRELEEINSHLLRTDSKYKIIIIKNSYKNKRKDMLAHIRNAVSHARVKFDGENFIFIDMLPNSPTQKIEFKLHKNEAGLFIQDLYNALLIIVKVIQKKQNMLNRN